jgi:tRNA-uridine 2-sulfurtransferase
VDALAFEHHLTSPQGLGRFPADGFAVSAEGGACGDRMRFSVRVDRDRVCEAGFEADGCGAATAAGSAAVSLVQGRALLAAARVGTKEIADELGGLSPGKLHAAELAADALARALGLAARTGAELARPVGGRTLVAMSGGVDSAVAALLAGTGGETVAVTLELWADPENDAERSCCSASAVSQARSLAHSLELPHFTIDLRPEFRAGVVEPFIKGYASGETPNPCVGCNGHIRLDAMLALADRLGCDWLATGHYARVVERENEHGPLLSAAADRAKDQTYMLAALAPRKLARMRFPLGELTKHEVRRIAAKAGLPVASKAESQDLCFLAGTDRARFFARHAKLADRPGVIADRSGRVLGRHRGQHNFTVGQRRGLGVAAGSPLYVLEKDAASNRVVVGPAQALCTRRVALRAVHLHRSGRQVDRVKLRYRSNAIQARLVGDPEPGAHRALELELSDPADAAVPGQLACLMSGERVIGWGTITR